MPLPDGRAAGEVGARGFVRTVLCVAQAPLFGGPHNQTIRLAEPLLRRGWETVVAIPDDPGTAAPRLRESGIELEELPLGRARASVDPRLLLRFLRTFPVGVRALEQAIERHEADVVQLGGLVNPHAAFAARRAGAAVVWQVVESGYSAGLVRRAAMAVVRRVALVLVRRFADAVMFDGEALIGIHGGRESLRMPTFVYFPPVETSRFVPSEERDLAAREELGIPPDVPLVGSVSNLTPVKGLETFLAAAERIAASRPDVRFVVIGSAPASHAAYGERLRQQAAELDLPQPIVFVGYRSDVERWYAAMDVHVIASYSEGTTTTALEAQSCGVPVVATRVGAVHEVVEDGVTGLLVSPAQADALAAAILSLLDDPARRAEMGRAGRAAALERFDTETSADVHARAYEAALEYAARRGSLP
jgi:glycosyltransferase involved in cell wall biosynthesis